MCYLYRIYTKNMATGHTLQPCGLQLAFGLDTYDLQRLIAKYNRITRINENQLQAQEVTSVESQPPRALHGIRRSVHKINLPPTQVPKPVCQTTEFKHFHDTFKSLVIKQTISRDIIIHCLQELMKHISYFIVCMLQIITFVYVRSCCVQEKPAVFNHCSLC